MIFKLNTKFILKSSDSSYQLQNRRNIEKGKYKIKKYAEPFPGGLQ